MAPISAFGTLPYYGLKSFSVYDTILAGCKEFNSHTLVKGSPECPEHFQLTVSILAKHSLNSSDAGLGNNAGKIKSEF